MEEKLLVKSESYSVKWLRNLLIILGIVVFLIMMISFVGDYAAAYDRHEHSDYCYPRVESYYNGYFVGYDYDYSAGPVCQYSGYYNGLSYGISRYFENEFFISLIPVGVSIALALFIYWWLHSYQLVVTDKRVFGKVAFGKRVDLPVDSVSATSSVRLFRGIAVSTASGRIRFLLVKNADRIYTVINQLIILRQQERQEAAKPSVVVQTDEADMLKKYKELLDGGAITQEEFDAKKKQILGL